MTDVSSLTNLTDSVQYLPIEYIAQLLVALLSLINGNWLFFLCQVPLAIYHGRLLASKTYKKYAITRAEYKTTQ